MKHGFVMPSPVGKLYIECEDDALVNLEFNTRKKTDNKPLTKAQQKIRRAIESYFKTSAYQFDLALALSGTEFQQKVWQVLLEIPAGQVKTYGEVAQQLNSSARAVGNACRANPVALIVPCHRVVAKNGLGGFSGKRHGLTVERKRWLLQHEGVTL